MRTDGPTPAVHDEIDRRDATAIVRRVRNAHFEQPTTLEDFDFNYNPSIPAAQIQTALAEQAGIHVTNIRRYEAGTNAPTLDALRNLTLALNTTADHLLFDPDERTPTDHLTLTLQAAVKRLDPDSQAHLQATIEGLLLRAETRRWQQTAS